MQDKGYRVAQLYDLPEAPKEGLELDAAWKPIRHHLGIGAFGINAYVADGDGQVVIEEHDESDIGHEELYVVLSGHATFELAGEPIDAPPGTLVFLSDPTVKRKATAREPGTAVLALGAKPGEAFTPSSWETQRTANIDPAA